jgi:hypothetical protein
LTARRLDVIAARSTSRRDDAMLIQNVAEPHDGRGRGASIVRPRKHIEWNQVEFCRVTLHQTGKLPCMLRLVVHAVEHYVFECDAAAVLLIDVVPARVKQFRDRMFPIDGHEFIAQLIVRRMQGNGQRDIALLG